MKRTGTTICVNYYKHQGPCSLLASKSQLNWQVKVKCIKYRACRITAKCITNCKCVCFCMRLFTWSPIWDEQPYAWIHSVRQQMPMSCLIAPLGSDKWKNKLTLKWRFIRFSAFGFLTITPGSILQLSMAVTFELQLIQMEHSCPWITVIQIVRQMKL